MLVLERKSHSGAWVFDLNNFFRTKAKLRLQISRLFVGALIGVQVHCQASFVNSNCCAIVTYTNLVAIFILLNFVL